MTWKDKHSDMLHKLLEEIGHLNEKGTEVTLHKVKAHTGIKGNEKANAVARRACEEGEYTEAHDNKEVIQLQMFLHPEMQDRGELIMGRNAVYKEVEKQVRNKKRQKNGRMQQLKRKLEGEPQEWGRERQHKRGKENDKREQHDTKIGERQGELTQLTEEELIELLYGMEEAGHGNVYNQEQQEMMENWQEDDQQMGIRAAEECLEEILTKECTKDEAREVDRKRRERQENENTRVKRIKSGTARKTRGAHATPNGGHGNTRIVEWILEDEKTTGDNDDTEKQI
ncbi:hypothetical protein CYMTET_52124 [Cymbomonas tetramitiformis]|uniref:RNase H type-1 domain-containing protein n=1 Tax=Cymbomonas tetramitiformis TaxID=36881 RepID=A0AAE0BLG4_9CHLO|nr:hypothetical protein CYMTET_52124 [Cymbomonas tetramitiformis]